MRPGVDSNQGSMSVDDEVTSSVSCNNQSCGIVRMGIHRWMNAG